MHGIQDIAKSVGSYIPLSAGMGLSYYSGSIGVNPERVAVGPARQRYQDEYLPSNPQAQSREMLQGIPVTSGENAQLPAEDVQPDEDIRESGESAPAEEGDTSSLAEGEYTSEEQRVINNLQSRDREVRDHEQAHMAAGGGYTGGVTYQFETGPDNRQYAVGGEVSIDASPIRDDPEATIVKMQVVRGAALAPANPSGQDRAVAAAAARNEANAHIELREVRAEEAREGAAGDWGEAADRAGMEAERQSRISVDAAAAYASPFSAIMFQPLVDLAG